MAKKAEEREQGQSGRGARTGRPEGPKTIAANDRRGDGGSPDEGPRATMAPDGPELSPWRRLATWLVAVVVMFLTAVPLALTALVVWRALGRPLLFRQTRAGLGMRTFTIQKFRTMHDRRDASGALLPDHLRETPTTRLLRRLRLDELPQLLAILRGDMAFVGPRPLLPETVREFGELGRVRCTVRPGVTGWAQVSGNSRLTDRQKLALDIWYIDHRSLTLDILILFRTVVTLIQGECLEAEHVAKAEAHLAARGAARSTAVPG